MNILKQRAVTLGVVAAFILVAVLASYEVIPAADKEFLYGVLVGLLPSGATAIRKDLR